jgi:hypothetical protein
MRTYIQMPGYWPEGSSGFHPIGVNGVSPDPRLFWGEGSATGFGRNSGK